MYAARRGPTTSGRHGRHVASTTPPWTSIPLTLTATSQDVTAPRPARRRRRRLTSARPRRNSIACAARSVGHRSGVPRGTRVRHRSKNDHARLPPRHGARRPVRSLHHRQPASRRGGHRRPRPTTTSSPACRRKSSSGRTTYCHHGAAQAPECDAPPCREPLRSSSSGRPCRASLSAPN